MDLETTWSDERHANGKPRLYRIPGWYTHRAHGFKRCKMERCLFVHESNETRVVSHVDDPLFCQASDAREILDADHEVGRDQERRSSHTWDSITEVHTKMSAEDSQ